MSNIPKARALLQGVLDGHELRQEVIQDISAALVLMTRNVGKRQAPRTSTPMTAELAQKLRTFALANPSKTQAEIAHLFRVNPGRVSEALRGKR